MKKQIFLSLFWVVFTAAQVFSQNYYDLYYNVGGTQYHGLLWLDTDGTGVMRVKYNNGSSNVMIEQGMETSAISGVPVLEGYNPVYAGTRVACSTYAPDVFFFTTDYYGNPKMKITDAYGNLATVTIYEVNAYNCANLKSQFGWR